ncbi:hypothetical protein [Nostoc sp.]|uniref:hypothetical protein n=1 Tax=Nostoc sp. TaxID=1180 RepID=UPI002FF9B2AB
MLSNILARNQIPYKWLNIELEQDAAKLVEYAQADGRQQLSLLLFPDASRLIQPSNLDIAAKIGLQTQAERSFYDLAIVGGGPTGLAAAVYGASEGLSPVLRDFQRIN